MRKYFTNYKMIYALYAITIYSFLFIYIYQDGQIKKYKSMLYHESKFVEANYSTEIKKQQDDFVKILNHLRIDPFNNFFYDEMISKYPQNIKDAYILNVAVSRYSAIIAHKFNPTTIIRKTIDNFKTLSPKYQNRLIKYISKYSQKYKIFPVLPTVIMKHESDYRSDVEGPPLMSGIRCQGLMQIHPTMHKEKLKIRNISSNHQLRKPQYNIDIGCQILDEYYKYSKGDIESMLYRYVGGNHTTYVNTIISQLSDQIITQYGISPSSLYEMIPVYKRHDFKVALVNTILEKYRN